MEQKLEQKIDLIFSQLSELNQISRAIRDRQDESDAKMESMAMDLNRVVGDVVAIRDRQDQSDAKIESMAIRMDSMGIKMESMGIKMESMVIKLDSMALDLNRVVGDISSLKDGQERQDRILESLAVKTLEQDSYIRDFKRKI